MKVHTKLIKTFGALLIAALLFAALPAGEVKAETITVCAEGCSFTSIQAAINAANPGDTINVAAGTYTEQLLIQKDLTLVGAGIDQTIVKAPTSGRGTAPGYTSQVWTADNWNTDYLLAAYPTDLVSGTSISVKVSGFTFDANGQAHTSGSDRFTGVYFRKVFNSNIEEAGLFDSEIKGFSASDASVTGIRVLESSKLTLSGNLVKDYTILGIVVYGTDNLVDPIVHTIGNTLTPYGGAQGIQYRYINRVGSEGFAGIIAGNTINGGSLPIAPAYSDNILVEDNVINNSADAGILLEASSSCTVKENVITNFVYNGIQVAGSNHVIQGNIISDNTGYASNGIAVLSHLFPAGSSGNQIIGNTISGIHSGDTSSLGNCGWGIGVESYGGAVTNTTITGNTVTGNDAGVVFFDVDASNVAHYNKIYGNSPYDLGNSNTSVTIDATKNWWGNAAGPGASQISGSVNTTPWYATATTTPETEKVTVKHDGTVVAFSDTIQGAIDAVPGDTIYVAAGTYVENLSMPYPVNLIGVDMPIIQGELTIDHSSYTGSESTLLEGIRFETLSDTAHDNIVLKGVDGITIKGCEFDGANKFMNNGARAVQMYSPTNNVTIEGSTFENGYYVTIQGSVTALTVKNSIIENVKSGINLQGGSNLVVEDTTISVIAQSAKNDTYGIRFASSTGTAENMTVLGGSISVDKNNLIAEEGTYHSAIVLREAASGVLSVEHMAIDGEVVNLSLTLFDASPNWWGSTAGPAEGAVVGDVKYSPWCGDAACETLMPDEDGVIDLTPPEGGEPPEPEEIQNAINNAPSGSTIVIPEGEYAQVGAFVVSKPNLTIKLSDGTVIQNSSPCFVVNASYTQILAEPGAKCIPTEGSNGIDVAADLTDIRVKGLEIDGSGQTTGDGIHFAGVVNGTVLVDNKIHDLGGDGIEFVESPTGTVDIHGNLFAFNGGDGINNSDTTSPTVVAAEYNSWGSYYGPTGEGGDGISANVDADPYTYGDFWMSSSDSPWADQVVKGQTITYTIKALVKEVNAADVTFTYPEGLTVTASQAIVTKFESGTLEHDTGTRTFTYVGMSTNGNENETVDLFSVTFTASATMSDAVMDIFEGSFGMAGVGSSSNVYVQGIDDGSITVIDLPTLTSTTIAGPYLAGIPQYFFMTATNPTTGGDFVNSIYYVFTIANTLTTDIDSLSCNSIAVSLQQSGDDVVGRVGWKDAGYTLEHGENWENTCNIKFKTPKDYLFTVNMVDNTTDVPADDIPLTSLTETAVVNGNFAITGTFSMQGRVTRGGIPVTLTWLEPGWDYAASADTEDLLVNNFQVTVTYGGSYRITTNQPRYLNVPGATPAVSKTMTLPDLYLYGGNANGDNAIGIGDASVVGGAYGTGNIESDGDVNFDNRVNIQDLALVGGNYGLTDEVYNDWLQ